MITKTQASNIATELRSIYGCRPAMEIVDIARAENALKKYGVSHVKDVFLIAQELNKQVA